MYNQHSIKRKIFNVCFQCIQQKKEFIVMSNIIITNCYEEMPCADMSLLPYGIPATLILSPMEQLDKIQTQCFLSLQCALCQAALFRAHQTHFFL